MDIDFPGPTELRQVGSEGFTPTHCSNQDCRTKLVKLRRKGCGGITYQCPNPECFNHFKSVDDWEEIGEHEATGEKTYKRSDDKFRTRYATDSVFRDNYNKQRLAYYYAHKKEINERRKESYNHKVLG